MPGFRKAPVQPAQSENVVRGACLTDYPLMIERRWIKLLDLNKKGNTGHE
jgi:hypothetical protein